MASLLLFNLMEKKIIWQPIVSYGKRGEGGIWWLFEHNHHFQVIKWLVLFNLEQKIWTQHEIICKEVSMMWAIHFDASCKWNRCTNQWHNQQHLVVTINIYRVVSWALSTLHIWCMHFLKFGKQQVNVEDFQLRCMF